MTRRIWAIALNTFREAGRNKILYGVLVLVALAMLFAMVLGEMSLHEEARVARDFGLGILSLASSITAIVLGVMLLYKEIERKTIHTILSKPIHRAEFVVGKYLGMALTLTLVVVFFTVALVGLLQLTDVPFDANMGKAVLLAWMGVLVVAAIAVFFSSFSSPYLSGIFTAGLFILGRAAGDLRYAADKAKQGWIRGVAKVALWILPDLNTFNISGSDVWGEHVSVHGTFVTWAYVSSAALYALALIAILLILASIIFWLRDFA
jgi:ABC-type transport system involved in multi-copper enzyme maturation permease subunit